jgi:hypothetical protein
MKGTRKKKCHAKSNRSKVQKNFMDHVRVILESETEFVRKIRERR